MKTTTETTKLIEQLADKLGTTSEYLWSVLLKQAPINSTISIIQFFIIIIFGYTLFKIHKRLMKKDTNTSQSLYDELEGAAIVPMMFFTMLFLLLFSISMFSIESIINGYLNPEFWALDYITRHI